MDKLVRFDHLEKDYVQQNSLEIIEESGPRNVIIDKVVQTFTVKTFSDIKT